MRVDGDAIRDGRYSGRRNRLTKRARKLVKALLWQYPATRRVYELPSSVARAAKLFRLRAIDRLMPTWTASRLRLALHYVGEGEYERAAAIAEDVLASRPEADLGADALLYLSMIYQRGGRIADCLHLEKVAETRRRTIAHELQYDRLGLRFFSREPFWAIGALVMFDRYIKAETLGVIPRCANIVLGDPAGFSNPAYARYWQKHFRFITEPRTIAQLAPLADPLQPETCAVGRGDLQLRWEAENRDPLLSLSDEHREQGYRLLRELGVPDGVWFVGLHVREASSKQERVPNLRNADILTYRLAVEEIAKRGGWVLRMGDPSMRPLPAWPSTIDYVHSGRQTDWMDVFLWAEGRFFIATASGPQLIPTTFGKPVAVTNYGSLARFYCVGGDIMLPKQYWHEKERRYLTIAERMNDTYGVWETIDASGHLFDSAGIRIIDNSPTQLRELVVEMMDRLQGRHVETEQERAFQARFSELAIAQNLYPVKIARAFLSRLSDSVSTHDPFGGH
jgi:putative glycosyltransferase (TIGR04372 family)